MAPPAAETDARAALLGLCAWRCEACGGWSAYELRRCPCGCTELTRTRLSGRGRVHAATTWTRADGVPRVVLLIDADEADSVRLLATAATPFAIGTAVVVSEPAGDDPMPLAVVDPDDDRRPR